MDDKSIHAQNWSIPKAESTAPFISSIPGPLTEPPA